jgi:hypothetical protein
VDVNSDRSEQHWYAIAAIREAGVIHFFDRELRIIPEYLTAPTFGGIRYKISLFFEEVRIANSPFSLHYTEFAGQIPPSGLPQLAHWRLLRSRIILLFLSLLRIGLKWSKAMRVKKWREK